VAQFYFLSRGNLHEFVFVSGIIPFLIIHHVEFPKFIVGEIMNLVPFGIRGYFDTKQVPPCQIEQA
jgi:hypothetical protein